MQTKVSTDLEFFTSDETFSLDELVLRLKNLFESHAYCSILHAFLDFFQVSLISKAATGRLLGHEGQRYAKDGTYRKMFRTSLGEFEMKMVRMKDPVTGKKLCPLRDFLGLKRYQTRSNELEKEVVEAVSSDSYRKSHDFLVHTSSLGVTRQTMHNWLLNTNCDEIDVPRSIADATPLQVLPDGTSYKGPGCNGKAVKGDLKIAIGVNTSGHVFPLGSWADASWREIAEEWKSQKSQEKGVCKMAKSLLKRFADETEWKSFWDKLFFATKPRVAVTFEITGVTNSSHNF